MYVLGSSMDLTDASRGGGAAGACDGGTGGVGAWNGGGRGAGGGRGGAEIAGGSGGLRRGAIASVAALLAACMARLPFDAGKGGGGGCRGAAGGAGGTEGGGCAELDGWRAEEGFREPGGGGGFFPTGGGGPRNEAEDAGR